MSTTDHPVFERERKFIVADKSILEDASWDFIEQGYLWKSNGYAIRARVTQEPVPSGGGMHTFTDKVAQITVKGPNHGDEREEYQMDVYLPFARDLINETPNVIRKRRYHVIDPSTKQAWEIDVFRDKNEGLIVAELESAAGFEHEETDEVRKTAMPRWAYKEVTGDTRFNNENLATDPVSTWQERSDWNPDTLWDWE